MASSTPTTDLPRSERQRREIAALVASGGSPVRRNRFDAPSRLIARPVDVARARRAGINVSR